MEVIVLFNGLGNQMSQYGFYLEKKRYNKYVIFISINNDHNGFELGKIFGLNSPMGIQKRILTFIYTVLVTRNYNTILYPIRLLLKHVFNVKIIKENYNYDYDSNKMLPHKGLVYYVGGWHNEKYFESSKKELQKLFVFPQISDIVNKNIKSLIKETNSVAIHVRRGDYLDENNLNIFGKVCTKHYYEKAIRLISQHIDEPHFFVFSNDINWFRENFALENVIYVDWNTCKNSWIDMYLMSLCKVMIIANSTFSWWGAWLNKNSQLIISPKFFVYNDPSSDIYPAKWTKITD